MPSDILGYTICDPYGHPWLCGVPKKFIKSELKSLENKIKRSGCKIKTTTNKDIEEIKNWTFENYQKRIEREKLNKNKK